MFRAKDVATGSALAIKRPKIIEDSESNGLSINMVREATILNSFRSHPNENILNLQDFFFRHDRIYLVFDLYHCNLRDHLCDLDASGRKQMCPVQLKSFVRQILSALAFCHDRRVMHRDMKPDNILLDWSKQKLVVSDFGMAKIFSERDCFTENCVTSWYRPPEILLGDTLYGPAVDMWSAGMIIAEMISLRPILRQAKTELECLLFLFENLGTPTESSWPGVTSLPYCQQHRIRTSPPRPASALVAKSGISELTADLLDRLLEICPSCRMTAAEALASDFFFANHDCYLPHSEILREKVIYGGGSSCGLPAATSEELKASAKRNRIDDEGLLCNEMFYSDQCIVEPKSKRQQVRFEGSATFHLHGFQHDFPPFDCQ